MACGAETEMLVRGSGNTIGTKALFILRSRPKIRSSPKKTLPTYCGKSYVETIIVNDDFPVNIHLICLYQGHQTGQHPLGRRRSCTFDRLQCGYTIGR